MMQRRIPLAICLGLTIACGLVSRAAGLGLPDVLTHHAGDVLWTVAVYWSLALVWPTAPRWRIALTALVISFAVEFSQLLDVPWLNAVRQTLPGRLLLGRGFVWADLGRYTVGAGLAILIDRPMWFPAGQHKTGKGPESTGKDDC